MVRLSIFYERNNLKNVEKKFTKKNLALAGNTAIEMPDVHQGTVVGWKVLWNKKRKFATDMAGFAIALNIILKFVFRLYSPC